MPILIASRRSNSASFYDAINAGEQPGGLSAAVKSVPEKAARRICNCMLRPIARGSPNFYFWWCVYCRRRAWQAFSSSQSLSEEAARRLINCMLSLIAPGTSILNLIMTRLLQGDSIKVYASCLMTSWSSSRWLLNRMLRLIARSSSILHFFMIHWLQANSMKGIWQSSNHYSKRQALTPPVCTRTISSRHLDGESGFGVLSCALDACISHLSHPVRWAGEGGSTEVWISISGWCIASAQEVSGPSYSKGVLRRAFMLNSTPGHTESRNLAIDERAPTF